jgi:NADPH:quinone reductase-like Zn-dependent oxidoreductase
MVKAVRYDEFGGIDVLRVEEVERPVPGDGQVFVRVKAAGINPSEAVIRTGAVAGLFPSAFPSGQGSDLAGVVEEAGAGVGGFSAGDEVIGHSDKRASQAELVLVEAGDLTRKPEKVSWEVAGGLFVAGSTAWGAVRAVHPREGETVVVSAAAGGVGSLAVQLAPYQGHGHRPGEREQPRVADESRGDPGRLRGGQRPDRAPGCLPSWPA